MGTPRYVDNIRFLTLSDRLYQPDVFDISWHRACSITSNKAGFVPGLLQWLKKSLDAVSDFGFMLQQPFFSPKTPGITDQVII